jgi:hypothetical protein
MKSAEQTTQSNNAADKRLRANFVCMLRAYTLIDLYCTAATLPASFGSFAFNSLDPNQ